MTTDSEHPLPIDADTLAARLRAEGHRVFAGSFTDERGAAAVLALSERTLRAWRAAGVGPRAFRTSRVLTYSIDELLAFIAASAVSSDAE